MTARPRQLGYSATPAPPPPMAPQDGGDPEAGGGLSMLQIVTILRSHWKQTAILALSITVVTGVVIKFLPKTYTAIATLIVNTENKDPLAAQAFPTNVLGNYVTTQTELMLSPVVLLPVVDRLKLAEDGAYTAGFRGGGTKELREYVERELAESVVVDTGRGGQLLYVSAAARDPGKAAAIANAVADVYLEQARQRINDPAGERAQRYSAELAELREKATAAQDKVTEFRQRSNITDLMATANNDTEMQALTSLETQLLAAQGQRRALEAKQTGQEATASETLASPQLTQLRTQLSTLESQLAQESATLGPRHPAVVVLNSRIAMTRQAIADALHQFSDSNTTELTRARDLEEKLTRAVAEQRAKVLKLRQFQDEGAKLTLELESAQAVYKRALDGYDQIMFASAGNYTNVTLIDRATPPLKASKPNKLKLMAMGIVAGLGLGLVVPFAYELFFHRRLRTRDDFERDFGIPVLGQFDAMTPAAGAR